MPSKRWPTPGLPARYEPQLATLVKVPPDGDDWLHEIKFDGYRFGCRLDHGVAKLLTRRGNDWTGKLPHIAAAAHKIKAKQALLDGEVAVVLPNGKTSFHGLQEALSGSDEGKKIHPVYFVFDVLFVDGRDTSKMRTEDRKAELKHVLSALPADSLVRYADHVLGRGAEFFANAKKLGLEGIISKRRSAAYHSGRTTDWLKVKAVHRQEFVVCGYILREGSTAQVGSLILCVRSAPGPKGHWILAGQVGTGFTADAAQKLFVRLQPLKSKSHPFAEEPQLDAHRWSRRTTAAVPHWVHPELVCDVAFTEWTPDGTLRHPSFQGLREDKAATEVVKENAASGG
jgi:bifunctional non-homologous end joining protein LigD